MLIIVITAFICGTCVGFLLVSLLSMNKNDDIEFAIAKSYVAGYEKGFNDGYESTECHKDQVVVQCREIMIVDTPNAHFLYQVEKQMCYVKGLQMIVPLT